MMSGFKSPAGIQLQSVKLKNFLRTASHLAFAVGFLASNQPVQSTAGTGEESRQATADLIQTVAATPSQFAVNPLTNFDWNTSLSKPAFRRIRFNERYGGFC